MGRSTQTLTRLSTSQMSVRFCAARTGSHMSSSVSVEALAASDAPLASGRRFGHARRVNSANGSHPALAPSFFSATRSCANSSTCSCARAVIMCSWALPPTRIGAAIHRAPQADDAPTTTVRLCCARQLGRRCGCIGASRRAKACETRSARMHGIHSRGSHAARRGPMC